MLQPMLLLLRYRLDSEFMAEQRTHTDTRKFRTAKGGRLETALATWEWALKAASKNFSWGAELDIPSVRPEPTWYAPVIALFTRTFMHNDRGGPNQNRSKRELFQCIPAGTILEHRIVISQGPDTQAARHGTALREPTVEELQSLFEHIGYYLGLSPWGNRFGHGRFTVISLQEISDATVPCNDTATVSSPPIPGQQRIDDLTGATGDTPVPDLSGEIDDDVGIQEGEDRPIYRASARGLGSDCDDVSRPLEEDQGAG